MFHKDGSMFEGRWHLNAREGSGCRWLLPDGAEYRGDFTADRIHGRGVMEWPDGRRHEGQWVRGKQHGPGRLCAPGDVPVEGVWLEGVLQPDGDKV